MLQEAIRLYRGLKEAYDSSRVINRGPIDGTDFSDCPFTALRFADGRRSVLLVVDAPSTVRVSQEGWMGPGARRLIFWGNFAPFVVAIIPAKDLRGRISRKGMVVTDDAYKSEVLAGYIEAFIGE